MGRIKTRLIKRVTKGIIRLHAAELKTSFEENKILIGKFAEIPSKKLRNTIAGYVTRLMKQSEHAE